MVVFSVKAAVQRPWLSAYEGFLNPLWLSFILGQLWGSVPAGQACWALLQNPLTATVLGLLWLLLLVVALSRVKARWTVRAAFWLLALGLGLGCFQWFAFHPERDAMTRFGPRAQAVIEGVLLDEMTQGRASGASQRFLLAVQRVDRQPIAAKIQVQLKNSLLRRSGLPNPNALPLGSLVRVQGVLRLTRTALLPGGFDEARYMRPHHVAAVLEAKQPPEILKKPEPDVRFGLMRAISRLRQKIVSAFRLSLGSPQAEILGGLVLGEHAIPLERSLRQQFIDTGLVHLLAASGMNVGILVAAALAALAWLRVPRVLALLLAMALTVFYALLTGCPPSIVRAASMVVLALGLKLWDRHLSPLSLLCWAVGLIVLLQPEAITSLGFQYSVLTTFGIVTMVPTLQRAWGPWITQSGAAAVAVPLVAQVWVLPLSLYYFNQLPLHAVLMNLLAVPLVAVLTPLGFVAGVAATVFPALGSAISLLALPLVQGLLWLAQLGSHWSGALWWLPSPSPGWLVLIYLALLWLGLFWALKPSVLPAQAEPVADCRSLKSRTIRQWLLGLTAVALLWLGALLQQRSVAVTLEVLPLSEYRAALMVRLPGSHSHSVLVPADLRYWEARTLTDYLRHLGIRRLDMLVLTPGSWAAPERLDGLHWLSQKLVWQTAWVIQSSSSSSSSSAPSLGQSFRLLGPGQKLFWGTWPEQRIVLEVPRFVSPFTEPKPQHLSLWQLTLPFKNACLRVLDRPNRPTSCLLSLYQPQSAPFQLWVNHPARQLYPLNGFHRFQWTFDGQLSAW
ncbi:MAG: ComEC/Rec2 family competence protein [Candidatus Melainabacteria bacterium]|nr:ComEC/Rec2 family competence protein [Candidatus Melainabacteria bacterium]